MTEGSRQAGGTVALFTRISKVRQVKQRLARHVGAQRALEVHRFLLSRTLDVLIALEDMSKEVWIAGDPAQIDDHDPLLAYRRGLIHQQGDSLGDRMAFAIEQIASRSRIPIIIGSDCPLMDVAYLQQALDAVQQDNDVVLGPADDGGYTLISMLTVHAELFKSIDWGTARVLDQTLCAADRQGLSVHLLDTLWDVDRVEDLERLAQMGLPDFR